MGQFLSQPGVTNILGRVVGGNPSIIQGVLQVMNPQANLYLMNPAGIVFGAGASLDIGGDFFATTADRIGIGGGWFEATGQNDYAELVGSPRQFAFVNAEPGGILNAGTLAVGGDLGLVGGTVVNTGQLSAPQGRVVLAAVPGTSLVNLSQPGMLLSLEVEQGAIASGITPLDLPRLLTWDGVTAEGVQRGDVAIAGPIYGQTVDLLAAGRVSPSDPGLIRTGDGSLSAPTVTRFATDPDASLSYLLIDSAIADYHPLLYNTAPGTIATVITPDQAGVTVVGDRLSTLAAAGQTVDSVQIFADGQVGNFWLGRDFVSAANVADYQQPLQTWAAGLAPDGDILLYSCFTALGVVGDRVRAIAPLATSSSKRVPSIPLVTQGANTFSVRVKPPIVNIANCEALTRLALGRSQFGIS